MNRRVELYAKRGPVPVAPLLPAQIPTMLAGESVIGQWTVCRADALAPDERTVLYVQSDPMNVDGKPDWQDRLQSERPFKPMLEAAGIKDIDGAGVSCTAIQNGATQATTSEERRTARFIADEEKKGFTVRKISGNWRLQ